MCKMDCARDAELNAPRLCLSGGNACPVQCIIAGDGSMLLAMTD